jgi:hypothetical protein
MKIHGLPRQLDGTELVTIGQMQNGQLAECTMPLSELSTIIGGTAWAATLSTTKPALAGVLWNDNGVVSIS